MWNSIVLPLAAGLAVFLIGMKVMELSLHHWAGGMLKQVLEKFTATPLRGLVTGAVMTALLHSSSALIVIAIGLVNAGMLTFRRTLGIVLGANIGTCLTTELIGLDITRYAWPLLLVSIGGWTAGTLLALAFGRRSRTAEMLRPLRYWLVAAGGFASVLLGMDMMQQIVPALQTMGFFGWFVEQSRQSLFWGLVAGMALSSVIQSSSATIAITMGLASVQAVTVDLSIAVVLGANIGTCVTGLIASIGASRSGQMVAWAQVVLNVVGAALFFPLIPVLQDLSALWSNGPSSQVAHAQTLFNVFCSLAALPLCYLPFLDDRVNRWMNPERRS